MNGLNKAVELLGHHDEALRALLAYTQGLEQRIAALEQQRLENEDRDPSRGEDL